MAQGRQLRALKMSVLGHFAVDLWQSRSAANAQGIMQIHAFTLDRKANPIERDLHEAVAGSAVAGISQRGAFHKPGPFAGPVNPGDL